jgi:hypothetical protein
MAAGLLVAMSLSACAPRQVVTLAPRPTGPVPVYANAAAGFALDVPVAWHGRYRAIELAGAQAAARHPGASHVVLFEYIGQSVYVAPHAVLVIAVVQGAAQAATQSATAAPAGEWLPVGETHTGLVVASLPGPNPYDPSSADAQAFEAMRVTVEQVRMALHPLASAP